MSTQIDVIAPNLKRRLSGVTATVVRLLPVQAHQIGIVATGPGLPSHVPHISLWRLPFLPRHTRVWHARRNVEMLLGLALKYLCRMDLRLLFTSASQRKHSGYTKWLIGQMDRVIATSSRTAQYLDRPCDVVLHGIDVDGFAPAHDRAALRARLGLPDAVLIGCYGRIRAQKGTGDFIEAMVQILPQRPQAVAVVMGRATEKHVDYLKQLKAQVAAAGLSDRVLFPPEVPVHEVADWYRALDLYVAPQRWEGFGLTVPEAMACAVPVIATKVGAFEEIVTSECGALVDPGDPVALGAGIAAFVDDPDKCRMAGDAARAHVEAQFKIEGEAARLVQIYREMLA
ncbi:glycosyl transferase family 1 [Thioclava sp. SK-1]|uniref:glycosyltransferase family 4 protein n=1 Tax=Thioclava sp. SK-1 TaxID=1889770 RepID=UPI000824FCFC|nr:glycosyltransferase family 4 protein [Thioclava sp. SK-1]OCX66771.1 glycosyl transferase family 1 [Thioclava sp. SK-1]